MRIALSMIGVAVAVLLTAAMFLGSGWTHPPIVASQNGYRGTGMEQVSSAANVEAIKYANVLPDPIEKASPDGEKAATLYKNVQVLTDLSADQFTRVMLSITEWVAPTQGCSYCHNVENLADDGLYTKVVARRMLQMTRYINTDWKPHVANTGVTCYTCHRGMPVPSNIWFNTQGPPHAGGLTEAYTGFGHPTKSNGVTGLPFNAASHLIDGNESIRVVATQALPVGVGASIQTTEQTYALMIQMSEGLGVNCTFCHNSRAFSQWAESTPQRVTAWHGLQMVRTLNTTYLDPLQATFPPNRLGPLGDGPKLNCATCHQGVNKPLYGVSMAKDYPELGGVSAP